MKHLFILFFLTYILHSNSIAQVRPAHIVVAIFENHSYQEIINSSSAPYINSLFSDKNSAVLTQSFALTHPSQPNYLMLFSGSNQGVTSNDLPANLPFTTLNLGGSLLQKSFTFAGYSESMPSEGYNGEISSSYVRKHNPWVNWQNAPTNGIPSALNKPFTSFPSDYNTLPTVSFVVPNLDNDMHDGSIATGDAWIQNNLNGYIQWCKNNNSLFILTFDEDDASANNQIVTVVAGQNVQGGLYSQQITHYNVLRTIEDLYGLPYAGASADSSSIRNIWKSSTLPISLLSFNAAKKGILNMLDWATSKEVSAASFEVERSADGKTFSSIGSVQASGRADNYAFADHDPLKGINYYRLKMLDKDGKYDYSVVKMINNISALTASIYPNPVKNVLSINLTSSSASNIQINITNVDGKVLIKKNLKGNLSVITSSINVSNLPGGSYLVTLLQDGAKQSFKFLKQ